MKKKATLKDIAELAGVSVSSVSMILSGGAEARFSPEKVALVRQAADQLNYFSPAQRSQKRQIAILAPSVNNPYHTMLIAGIDQAAYAKGYTTCVFNTYWNPETEVSLLSRLTRANYCGIIIIYTPMRPDKVQELAHNIPIVAIGDRISNLSIDTVDINNYHAGELVAEHLLSLGHRHIAYLTTAMNEHHISRTRRAEGIRDYYAAHCPQGSVTVIEEQNPYEVEIHTPYIEYSTGVKLAKRCLALPEITAIVAINDMVGYGIYDTLIREGYSIPDDYSICGFDNVFPSAMKSIDLTSVDNATIHYGKSTLELLLQRVENGPRNGENAPISRIEYLPKLIIRGSTGTPRIK